jgi:ubiquinol-cytochrome c reductase cytochrome c subunit
VIFVVLINAALVAGQTPAPAATAPAQRPQAAPAGNAENGGKLFGRYGCYQCHGREGQGGLAGPRIAPNPPAVTTLIRYVRAPRGEMPPYTEKLLKSDQDLIDIHAYLSSRAAAKPQNIPASQ